jgi:hypothetical protein
MGLRKHVLTFIVLAVVMLIVGLIAEGGLSGSVVVGALCVGVGGIAGVAYRNQRRASA